MQQRFARALAGNLRRLSQNRIEIAVRLEELHRGLVPDALHARDVVRGVADQGEVIHHPLRRDAQALVRIRLIDPLFLDRRLAAASRIEERNTRTDQLIEILVARDDDGLEVTFCRPIGEGGNHIVGLIAGERDDGNMESVENLADALERAVEVLLQLLTQLLARRLVLGVLLLPERNTAIVHPADVFGMVVVVEPQ